VSDAELRVVLSNLLGASSDPEKLQMLRATFRPGIKFGAAQAAEVVATMEFPQGQARAVRELWPDYAEEGAMPQLLSAVSSQSVRADLEEELKSESAQREAANAHITDLDVSRGSRKSSTGRRSSTEE